MGPGGAVYIVVPKSLPSFFLIAYAVLFYQNQSFEMSPVILTAISVKLLLEKHGQHVLILETAEMNPI